MSLDLRPLYPLVNVITGSPPPFRNGGIWKFVKRALFRELKLKNFIMHAYHFFDFSLSRPRLERWLNMSIKEWISRYGGGAVEDLFVDSGGYKFLTAGVSEKYGIRIDYRNTLELQLRMGADRVASLDFPYPPWLSEDEKLRRREMTERGWEYLMELEHPRPYFVVHGHEYREVRAFAEKLKGVVRREDIGVAIGSLIPVRKEHWRVFDAVRAVREVFPEAEIHVFGITGSMMPYLLAAGADTFDSKSYMDAAIRWRMISFDGSRWRYLDPEEPGDGDWYHLVDGGSRSAEYAKIALHNLQQYAALLERFEERGEAFFEEFAWANPRARSYLRALRSHPRSRVEALPPPDPPRTPRATVVIQCSARKPYHASRIYRKVRRALIDAGLREAVEIAVLSALHGIVRESEFLDERYMSYDARLLVPGEELIRLVREQVGDLPEAVGYATGRPYRRVLESAGLDVLPRKVRTGRAGEALSNEGIRELIEYLRTRIGRQRPPWV